MSEEHPDLCAFVGQREGLKGTRRIGMEFEAVVVKLDVDGSAGEVRTAFVDRPRTSAATRTIRMVSLRKTCWREDINVTAGFML